MRAGGLYAPQDWLLVRAPRLPAEDFLRGGGRPGGPDDAAVRLAVAVASPSLLAALDRPSEGDRDAVRAASKLMRYRIRMSTRPTPYGMFAGVALGRFAPSTDLGLAGGPVRTRTRPDMGWLMHVAMAQEADPDVRRRRAVVANPTAFEQVGRLWLAERAPVEGTGPQARVSVRATRPARLALDLARRPIGYADLRAALLEATGAPEYKVEGLLEELWRQTFLLTDLRPPLTSVDPLAHVTARLDEVPAAKPAGDGLRRVRDAAAGWDSGCGDRSEDAFRNLVATAEAVMVGPPATGDAVQVDMGLPLSACGVSHRIGEEAARAAELLLRLSPWPEGPPYLAAYREAFETRYPDGRDVPLLEVVDPDHGLGPPAAYGSRPPVAPARAARRAQALTDIAHRALGDRAVAVSLEPEQVAQLETWPPSSAAAPPSLEINVFVAAPSPAAVDEGDFRLIVGPNVGGGSAGKNLGRFADLLGPAAVEALERSARAEEASAPERVWAELVYCPRRFRSANVALRPPVRAHEIVVGVSPGVDQDHVVPVDELVVGVRHGRFSLRWSRTGAEVRVCAGHMLNTQQAPDLCRLLTDIGKDGEPQLGAFDWGPASGFPFLPRVEVGRIVLALARWNVGWAVRTGELQPADPAGFEASQQRWRARWRVPRHVYMSEGDNRLLLDLDDAAHLEELRRDARRMARGGYLAVEEVLPGFDELWLRGPAGRYFCELVVPLLRRPVTSAPVETPPASPVRSAVGPTRRLPGTDWLYAKIYGPPALADDLLVDHLRPYVSDALARELAEGWFFIRYSDPDPHLRLRFRGEPATLLGTLLPELCGWAAARVEQGTCHRLAIDTYEREVARFGGEEGAALAEAVFAVDSTAVLELLAQARDGDLDRIALATLAVDNLLAGMGLDGVARTAWYRETVTGDPEAGAEYRRRKEVLRPLLATAGKGHPVAAVLADARRGLAPLGRAFQDRDLGERPATIYRSLIHLHCNRLLGTSRADERLVLGLARRTRQSLDAHPAPTA